MTTETIDEAPVTSEATPSETFGLTLSGGQEITVTRKSVSDDFDVYTVSGLTVPPEMEAIGRENSAALEEMMKKIDG
jgi:hypothetical protein